MIAALLASSTSAQTESDDAGASAAASEQATPKQETSEPNPSSDDSPGTATLEEARKKLESYSTVQADLLETVAFGRRKFRARGRYIQGENGQLRIKLEVVTGETEETDEEETKKQTSAAARRRKRKTETPPMMLQVCDGQILWTHWEMAGEKQITRRDTQEILKSAAGLESLTPDRLVADLGLGGIKALLASLQEQMRFADAKEETIDDKPFVVLQGKWKEEQRVRMAQGAPATQPLPQYIPDYVRIYLDSETLFPRRLLYLKRHPTEKKVRPMVTLDLTGITLNAPVDSDLFNFVPPEGVKPQDITQQIVDQIKKTLESRSSAPEAGTAESAAAGAEEGN